MTYRLADRGRTFATRPRGAELRCEVLAKAAVDQDIVLDLGGVLSVSSSFADEFIAEMVAARPSDSVSVVNASDEVRRVVDRVLANRDGSAEQRLPAALTYL